LRRYLVVFDGDDTLWRTEGLYDGARNAAAQVISDSGLDGRAWVTLQKATDLRLVKALGLSGERFGRSFEEAFVALCLSSGISPDPHVLDAIKQLAASVFTRQAPMVEGAVDVLAALSSHHILVLHTQGEEWVQRKRIDQSRLESFFEYIYVVRRKDDTTFRGILDEIRVDPDEAWSIGNSLPSDINPALAIGMAGIWIPTHVWDHERRETGALPGRLHIVQSILEVPPLLDSDGTKESS